MAGQTIQHAELLGEVTTVFEESLLRRLMVLDGDKLVGILSRHDIVRCIRDQRLQAGDQHCSMLVSQT
jgi:predicted transcriptional regulator